MAQRLGRCTDCHKVKPIRARERCCTCYGRFYLSPHFTPVIELSAEQHRLSGVNADARTAACSRCGPVRITKCGNGWRCNTTRNRQKRNLRLRRRYASVPVQEAA